MRNNKSYDDNQNITINNNQQVIESHIDEDTDVYQDKKEIDYGLASIYLLVVRENNIFYTKIFPDRYHNPFDHKWETEGTFLNIKYLIKISFGSDVLFYDVQLFTDEQTIIKVLFGQNLRLNLDDLKYPFLNNAIKTPPSGDTTIVGPLMGTDCYLQSGSISGSVSYYTFKSDDINSHYLLESPWMEIKDFEKLIFYEKIIMDIKLFFGSNIDVFNLVKIYQTITNK